MLMWENGVLVYITKLIPHVYEIVDIAGINCIKLCFSVGSIKLCITAIYRLHSLWPHLFNEALHTYLKTIKNDVDYSILVGDININILSEKDFVQEYLNILIEENYESQINKYTRIDGQRKSCIDHIFVRNTSTQSNITPIILHDKITDHFPVILHLNIQ